jgi:DNA-binding transcriptional LysR family regulator
MAEILPALPTGAPTFDQLRVFLAVVEAGSFAAAARELGRAVSVVSYQVDNLEAQLGVSLFERIATRRPTLTPEGRALLGDARAISHGVDRLRTRARRLVEGDEAEVSLAVDVLLPTQRLADAARAFREAYPLVPLHVHVESLGAVTKLVLDRTAAIGVGGLWHADSQDLDRIAAGSVQLVPVCAPSHPLAGREVIEPGEAREHIQLVLSERPRSVDGEDFGVLGVETWRLADLSSKHALLLAGIGWGSLPRPMIEADLRAGRLVALDLPDWPRLDYAFSLIHRTDTPPGPAGRWLIRRLSGEAGVTA